ncbi:hypothetical protein XA68_14284 [Ophiocordyceps unilateralis]|uniref:Utp8 beta-propeller domain-containing protein n=1 Tax=Ophiocordyceps unilateralis TaxID=268505 RepID=A0A2A9PLP6_OPHUN|nr:hypothetical protein XA68_14284 [Ophiocordyceps unilateralis]
MAHEYRIHRPCVLAALPRPLDPTKGRIVARELYGRKGKKRNEVAVGIDGENASLYDVPTSRLITSYPIPPQESFTCAPYSVRLKHSGSSDVLRCTFLATQDGSSQKMTFFKDIMHPDGATTSTTSSQILETSPVRYITSCPTSQSSDVGDVITICRNGEIVCLSGETTAIQWTASAKSALKDLVPGGVDDLEVDFVASGSLNDFGDGIFKKRPQVLSALPNGLDCDPTLLVMVTRSASRGEKNRHLVVLAALPGDHLTSANSQKLMTLDVTPIGSPRVNETTCQIDIQSGLLIELSEGAVSVYDITGAVPKRKSTSLFDGVQSFLRLSRPFILTLSLTSVGLFNYQHRSVHAKTMLDTSDLPPDSQTPRSCQLITYLRGTELAIALIDNVLVSIYIEPPTVHGKRRKRGLLIDSIGCGAPVEVPFKRIQREARSTEFSRYIFGTMSEKYLEEYNESVRCADELLSHNDVANWENLLRQQFGMKLRTGAGPEGGARSDELTATSQPEPAEWEWQKEGPYPKVDRRWVMYAISQVFTVDTMDSDQAQQRLQLVLPDSNVTMYLVVAGHLTMSNLISAFRADVDSDTTEWRELSRSLIECLVEADPTMTLLLRYLQATRVGAVEAVMAIRTLMLSMDFISDSRFNSIKPSTNETHDATKAVEMDLDDLERQIAVSEHYLGDESSSQSRGMTLAFTKLWCLPAQSTVKALRATMPRDEILALMHLLRVELIRGAWTTLYLDPTGLESEGHEPPPDGVIALIADLLGRCLDAIGASGWLLNDSTSWAAKAEVGDFLVALKLEVSAALEGVQEAAYVKGLVSQMVRFGLEAGKRPVPQPNMKSQKPITLQVATRQSRLLPFGLKAKGLRTKEKVASSGGEIVQRSARELGHMKSRHVGAYSLEKISI